MSTPRLHDWPTRLLAVIESARSVPFAWGGSDCCLFACDCILAMTGVDPAACFRGRYHTKSGARRSLKAYAGAGLEAVVERITRERAMPEVPPRMAQRGDVLLITAPECPPERLALAICCGACIAAQGAAGLIFVPFARGLRAWRV